MLPKTFLSNLMHNLNRGKSSQKYRLHLQFEKNHPKFTIAYWAKIRPIWSLWWVDMKKTERLPQTL
jgi:hypothetical protein